MTTIASDFQEGRIPDGSGFQNGLVPSERILCLVLVRDADEGQARSEDLHASRDFADRDFDLLHGDALQFWRGLGDADQETRGGLRPKMTDSGKAIKLVFPSQLQGAQFGPICYDAGEKAFRAGGDDDGDLLQVGAEGEAGEIGGATEALLGEGYAELCEGGG